MSPSQVIDAFRRPEEKILLCCAHTAPEAERQAWLTDLLVRDLDWEYLFGQASQQGLLCFLLRALEGAEARTPESFLERLRETHRGSLHQGIRLTRALFRILDLAGSLGIRVLPIKGPPLAVQLYGEFALRPSVDLDMLVSREDRDALSRALIETGHTPDDSNSGVSTAPSRKHLFHWSYRDPEGLRVELHWGLAQPDLGVSYSFDELWQDSRRVYLAGRQVPFPGPEPLLVLLSLHLARHRWRGLRWLQDIAYAANRQEVDWEKLRRLSASWGADRVLLTSLKLARDVLGATVPESIPLRRRRPQILAAWARSLFFSERARISIAMREHLLAVLLRKRLPDKMRYLLRGFGVVDWHGGGQSGVRRLASRLLSLLGEYRSRPDPGHRR